MPKQSPCKNTGANLRNMISTKRSSGNEKTNSKKRYRNTRQEKGEFINKARTAKYDRQFVVLLKDKTELEANLVSVSNDHDLALLRIDRCRSPYLQSGAPNQLIQGMRVFAIGSPLGFGDSVSSGVLSGYDNDYIRTDAKNIPWKQRGAADYG